MRSNTSACRSTMGGTACSAGRRALWSGRCTHLDDIDYAARPGCPVGMAVRARRHRASPRSRLPVSRPRPRPSRGARRKPPRTSPRGQRTLDPTLLRPVCWQFSQDTPNPKEFMRLGPRFRPGTRTPRLRILLHATVTHLNTTPSGARIESVEVADRQGNGPPSGRAPSSCAPAASETRASCSARTASSDGVGNAHGVVGRY